MTCGGWSGKMTANALSCSVRPWSRDWYIMCGVTPVVVLNSLFFFSSPFVTSFHNIWFLVIWRRHHGRPSIFFHAVGKCEDVKTQSCAANGFKLDNRHPSSSKHLSMLLQSQAFLVCLCFPSPSDRRAAIASGHQPLGKRKSTEISGCGWRR